MVAKVRPEKLAIFSDNVDNEVHKLFELLSKNYSNGKRIRISDTFDDLASDPAIKTIEHIASMSMVSEKDKAAALTRIYETAAQAIAQLHKPKLSKKFWKDRGKENRFADPCDFVVENFPSYGHGLSQSDIRGHDFPLYKALHNRKQRHGWPAKFDLPTQMCVNTDALAQILRAPTLKEISDAAPHHIQEMIRLYELSRARKRTNIPR